MRRQLKTLLNSEKILIPQNAGPILFNGTQGHKICFPNEERRVGCPNWVLEGLGADEFLLGIPNLNSKLLRFG